MIVVGLVIGMGIFRTAATAAKYKEKIRGFNIKKEVELFLVNEPKEVYGNELKLY